MKPTKNHRHKERHTLKHAGLSFLCIHTLCRISLEDVQKHSAVIIEVSDFASTRIMISAIRRDMRPDVYLKPVFLLRAASENDPVLDLISDGSIGDLVDIDQLIPATSRMLRRAEDIAITASAALEMATVNKLLNLLYVKEMSSIAPIPSVYSRINYSYPLLSVCLRQDDEHLGLFILETAEKEEFLTSEYHDKVYICPSCSSGHLNYREICPQCQSSNTFPDDIIHHFACGYVGPMRDFKETSDSNMECPKCKKRLRHIGVDYDKPSVIYQCRQCAHNFQNYNVSAKCMTCHVDSVVENLRPREIRSYNLTEKGKSAPISGDSMKAKCVGTIDGTVTYDAFTTILSYEIELLKKVSAEGALGAIGIRNASELSSVLAEGLYSTLLKDLVAVVRSIISPSDAISFMSPSVIVFSIHAASCTKLEKSIHKLRAETNKLFTRSLAETGLVVDLLSHTQPLDNKASVDNQLRGLEEHLQS